MDHLIRHLPAVIYQTTVHGDGRISVDHISEACNRILGLAAADVMANASVVASIIHPEDLDGARMQFAEAYERGEDCSVQLRVLRGDEYRWIEIHSNHEAVPSGAIIRRGIIQDVTARRMRAEQDASRLRMLEDESRKNETLLEQLFQTVPMALVLLSSDGKVTQVNRGFEEMFGYTLEEVKGRSVNDFIVPEDLRHEGIGLQNMVASSHVIFRETVRLHRSGRPLDVLLYGMPVKVDRQTIGIYGVYIDITARKRMEEELTIRNAELDNFVYKVSHDLRAPLSSILGLVNLARLPGNTDDLAEYINLIGAKVEHLDNFIGDVLSHSKNLKMEVTVSLVDIRKIIDQAFSDLNYLKGAKGMSRMVRVEGIEFYSDAWRVAEIFRNLVSNAIKYRKFDQPNAEVSIRVQVDHLRAEIVLTDNGIGIDKENLARIFEMFYRATEQSDGSGIGLYIVRNAIDKLGGQISVGSNPGEGTRFTIILPNRISSALNNFSSSEDVMSK